MSTKFLAFRNFLNHQLLFAFKKIANALPREQLQENNFIELTEIKEKESIKQRVFY